MAEVKLNFVLAGKTGQGKSSTGNTILNRRVFKTSARMASETQYVENNFSQLGQYILHVVDGPRLEDTDLSEAMDKMVAATNMEQAVAMCYKGVDAFLLVIKFGSGFTEEDRNAIESLKRILGGSFMKHVIVVMTCGDIFQRAMEEEHRDISFHEWCREKRGVFHQLYNDCEGRFVLFNNWERDEERKRAQILEVVHLAESLQRRHGRYTSQCFKDARHEREMMMLKLRAPQFKEEVQQRICLLTAQIDDLAARPSENAKKRIKYDVQHLRHEIEKEDKGSGVFKECLHMLEDVEYNLFNSAMKLQWRAQNSRKSKECVIS